MLYNKSKNVIKKKRVIKNLIWDDGNVAHIAKHDVLPSEVEEALEINRVEWEAYKERIFIVGPTKTGRMLTVIFSPFAQSISTILNFKQPLCAFPETNPKCAF